MTHGFHLLRNPVEFITASKECVDNLESSSANSSSIPSGGLSGKEAKSIYETIINEPSTVAKKPSSKREILKDIKPSKKSLSLASNHLKEKKSSICKAHLTSKDLFKAAENGNLSDVKRILESGVVDVNSVDQFSWTALMMASHGGHEEVVKYLLVFGADWEDEFDGSGYDAYDLACIGGHCRIAHLLQNRKAIVKAEAKNSAIKYAQQITKGERLWCDICKVYYSIASNGDEDKCRHDNSISHQFCIKRNEEQPSSSYFYLDNRNKGYQMLQREGWDGNSGLGPCGSGQKYPVKTVLKRDRSGFGCESSSAKVTHFASNDGNSVKKSKPVKQKNIRKRQKEKRKAFETEFRRSFY